jgi:tetratricopeptide (TPR) repeat protein
LLPHARKLAQGPDSEEECNLLSWIGRYDFERGAYGLARTSYGDELEALHRLLGQEHPDTLRAMNNLAQTLFAQGELAGARDLQERALEALHRLLGQEHPDTSLAAFNLVVTLLQTGDDLPRVLEVIQSTLQWLLLVEPGQLSHVQCQIREQLAKWLAEAE